MALSVEFADEVRGDDAALSGADDEADEREAEPALADGGDE